MSPTGSAFIPISRWPISWRGIVIPERPLPQYAINGTSGTQPSMGCSIRMPPWASCGQSEYRINLERLKLILFFPRYLTHLPLQMGFSVVMNLPTDRFAFGMRFVLDPSGLRRGE